MGIEKYAKAMVPVFVGAIVWVCSQLGVTADMSLEEAITFMVTAGLVYFVPNKK